MEIVTKIAPIALALIMLGLGLGLTTQDFTRVLRNPKDFLVGFIAQLIILPIVAFLLIKILNTPTEIALGVMIIAAAPGGITSNVLTKFAKGDVALSISLTAIISIISIITVPLIVFTSANILGIDLVSQEINLTSTALKMAGVVALPVILGMIIISININNLKNSYILPLYVVIFSQLYLFFFLNPGPRYLWIFWISALILALKVFMIYREKKI